MNDIQGYELELSRRLLPRQYIELAQLMVEKLYQKGISITLNPEEEIRIQSDDLDTLSGMKSDW